MGEVRRFREAGFTVLCVPEVEGAVRRHLLPDPAAALAAGEPVKRNMYRAVARVVWPEVGAAALKVHVPHGLGDTVRGVVRPSRARSEWRAARYLGGAGIPTATPWLVAQRRRGPLLATAVYAARWLGGRTSFEPALAAQPAPMARALLVRAARLVRALHDRGVSHGDLHGGNVLVAPGPGDRCDLRILDLHTVALGRPVSSRRRNAQLARWVHGLAGVVGPGGRLRTLLAYLGERPPRAVLARAHARLSRRLDAWERRRIRSRTRRCVEENVHFTRRGEPWRGWRRHEWTSDRIDRAVARHDRALAVGGPEVLKRGRKSLVTRHGDVVVKERLAATPARRLVDRLVPRVGERGYRHAHALEVRGFATASALACVRREGRTVTIYEDLSRFPRLDRRLREGFRPGGWDRGRRREVLDATADFVARLHRGGVWHGDLKAVNLLLEEGRRGPRLHLLDTDRMRFSKRPLSRARRLRNLAQLAASVPVVVTKTDRLRWWRRYARGGGGSDRAVERAAAREVARRMARKTLVRDEPIE